VIHFSVSSDQSQWYPPLGAAHSLVYRWPGARGRTGFMLVPARVSGWTLGIVEIVRRIRARENSSISLTRGSGVEAGSALAGLTYQTATVDPAGTILSLTLIDK
jgi:hypothetical protein